MALSELCFHLQERRGMYLPDGRYASAVAFVEGYNTALGGASLRGFQQWLSKRVYGRDSGVHWSYIVASIRVNELRDGGMGFDRIPPDQDEILINDLVELIAEFVTWSARGFDG
ncbi:hypothetical protein [Actinomadura rayongensis]|uniref:Uncharacterized protein n=1 Tax=Actinomadura rayongensis TaxID=1429076 RepID=A0A6I4WAR6_9ACTN|nr:hypothetical protein [Actinomadura rayongensis]MXQ65850.1 hypothetical protein [Actinomadura rayongensis]